MEIFKGQNLIEFVERFNTNEKCQEYLSEIKWSKAYIQYVENVNIPNVKFVRIILEHVIFVMIRNRLLPIRYFIN